MTSEKSTAKTSIDFQLIFESTPDLYLILTPDLHIVTASRAYLRATNTRLEDIRGRYCFDVFPDNPQNPGSGNMRNVKASFERVLKNRKVDVMAVLKYDIRRPDGSFEERYWTSVSYPVMDANRQIIYILQRAEDVTALAPLLAKSGTKDVFLNTEFLAHTLDALHDSEARYAGMISSAMDGIISMDAEEKIIIFNAMAERIFGYSAHEVIGKKIDFLMPERFRKAHTEQVGTYGKTNISHRQMGGREVTGLRANGEEFPIEASISQIGSGSKKYYTVIMRDLTSRKKIEAQFLRAQRMESIGTLAGGIAHDLNNILAPILLSIGLLKTMIKDEKTREVLDTIDISAKRGSSIVQQVLSFARGIEGQVVEVNPKHLLNDVEMMLKDTLPKDIRLKITLEPGIWTLMGDPTQLHQIFLNLCVNARDAMPNGGVLTIAAQNVNLDDHYVAMNIQAKTGPHIMISVTDTGTGIPPGIIDKIFEPFFTTKGVSKGTGLGLSTALAITKSHGGFVNVYSEPNKGTTFKIYLPAKSAPADVENRRREEVMMPRGNGETILVVDDEASILTITSQTLEAFGYRVITAENGAQAVAAYAQRQKEIAVVITDMMMPVMDGPATIQALMQINPKVNIIAASGLDANGGVAKATDAGIRYFLKKPYTALALLKMLDEILRPPEK